MHGAARSLGTAALLLVSAVGLGCGPAATKRLDVDAATVARERFRTGESILWIDGERHAATLGDYRRRGQLFAKIRRAGFTRIAVETSTPAGVRLLDSSEGRNALVAWIRDARAAGLGTALLHKPFASQRTAPRELQQQTAIPRGDGNYNVVVSADLPGNRTVELSPASATVRARVEDEFRRLLELGAGMIVLVDFGYENSGADVSPSARADFERRNLQFVGAWPADVLPEADGSETALGREWVAARAMLLREMLFRLRERVLVLPENTRPTLAVLVDAWYPAHMRRGLNWALPGAADAGRLPRATGEYAATGAGHLVDAVMLGAWVPAATEEEARAGGWEPGVATSAAVEDARRIAGAQTRVLVTAPVAMAGDPDATRQRLASLSRGSDGVLVLSLSSVEAALEGGQRLVP